MKIRLIYTFFLIHLAVLVYSQHEFDYYPLTIGINLGSDYYKTDAGHSFNTSENYQSMFLTRSANRVFLLAEMDFAPSWPQQSSFNVSNIDTFETNTFSLMNVLLAFYKDNEKTKKLGWFFRIDWTLRQADLVPKVEDVDNRRREIASVGGMGFGAGLSFLLPFGDKLVTNHQLGIMTVGNAQNNPNWIARDIFYQGNVIYPLTGRFTLNGYFSLDSFKFIDQQRLSTDSGGTLINWNLRFGIGIHLGKEKMI